jgi:ActR/RegA family two-component response regulator
MHPGKVESAIRIIRATLENFTDDERATVFDELAPQGKAHNAIKISWDEIEMALVEHGNVGAAARALGCSHRTLQAKMRRLGFPPGKAGRGYREL